MIDDTTVYFPNNAVNLTAQASQRIDSDLTVVRRPLRQTDPIQSVGVVAALWTPEDGSEEIGALEPTLQRYLIGIQAMIKDMDEERGLAVHSVLSKLIRGMLYRDSTLRVGLQALRSTVGGSTERTQRWGVRTQRYLSNEVQGTFLYLSTLEFFIETETV